ncbi:MAG: hypothetical protein J6X55_15560 [Victivallales bacterium]|nr:hypothetical protein [Victivallales bacterium]
MSLNVNEYNQIFQDFVDFASERIQSGKEKSIAQLNDGDTPIGAREISDATSDGVGGFSALFRTRNRQNVNNLTRELFKNAVIEVFGGESKIPESVKTAMKLQDFGLGKPLTARRIMAVKEAIDIVATKVQTACTEAKTHANHAYTVAGDEGRAQIDERINNVITSCIEDPDVLPIVIKNMDVLLVRGDGLLRSTDAILRKIDDIKANFAELKEVSQKNPVILNAGRKCITELNGKSFPTGVITEVVKVASKLPIDDFSKLSASSSGTSFHKGAAQFYNNVNDVMNRSIVKVLEGSDDMRPCREFVADVLCSRISKSNLEKIYNAFSSDSAQKVMNVYVNILTGNISKPGTPKGLSVRTSMTANAHLMYINRIKQSIHNSLGKPVDDFHETEPFNGDFNRSSFNADFILNDIKNEASSQLAKDIDIFISQTVQGDGEGSSTLKKVINRRIGSDSYDPLQTISTYTNGTSQAMLNWNMLDDCKLFAEGKDDETQFAKDIIREFDVNLPDGRKMSNDFNEARDQIAQLVTKNPNTTYANLDGMLKHKAHIVMSLLSQQTIKAATDGIALGLDPNLNKTVFNILSNQAKNKYTFTLKMESDGALFMNLDTTLDMGGKSIFILNDDGENYTQFNQMSGSKASTTVQIRITKAGFDRLTKVDFTKYDEVSAMNAFKQKQGTDRLGQAINSLSPEFRFQPGEVECKTSFSLYLK